MLHLKDKSDSKSIQLAIRGMSCASCSTRIEKLLRKQSYIADVVVNLALDSATVTFNEAVNSQHTVAVLHIIEAAGYHAALFDAEMPEDQENASFIIHEKQDVVWALCLTAPLILPMFGYLVHQDWMLPVVIQFFLASVVQFWFGARFYRAAWQACLARMGNMDLLVVLGTSSAYLLSLYQWFFLGEHAKHAVYFEDSATVISFILLGKYLESRAKHHTSSAIRALRTLHVERVIVRTELGDKEMLRSLVQVNDLVVVLPGKRMPVDGVITEGASDIDESYLTGESLPVPKCIGDSVKGGSMNLSGVLLVRVSAVGQETILSKMIQLVESAQMEKAPVQRLVDKVSAVFVPCVIVLAMLTALGWFISGAGWDAAIVHATAVLVVACPCALGLATPTAMMVGTGMAARHGILIKDISVLETAGGINTVVFDKTGTLTEGHPVVTAIEVFDIQPDSINNYLSFAAALQQGSEHPLAHATVAEAKLRGLDIPAATESHVMPGYGVTARVKEHVFYLGNTALLKKLEVDISPHQPFIEQWQQAGYTYSWLVSEYRGVRDVLGVIAFGDKLKKNASEVIAWLHKHDIQTVMLTGDNRGSAHMMAKQLGISHVEAEVLPEDKVSVIRALKSKGAVVAMIGDGINDAPALAMADISMAMSTGTDVAMSAAGITLMRGDLVLVIDAIALSRITYRKIKQNLFWAFIYNALGIPLAALGYLEPMLAGALMALSSVSVVSNALWLRRWRSFKELI